MNCREWEAEDLDQVAALAKETMPYAWSKTIFSDCFQARYRGWVLLKDDKILGFAVILCQTEQAELLNLCVHTAFQRQGHARCLMDHVVLFVREQAVSTLFLEVRQSNYAAISLYESYGFSQVGIRRGYYPSPLGREDAVLLSLDLSSS